MYTAFTWQAQLAVSKRWRIRQEKHPQSNQHRTNKRLIKNIPASGNIVLCHVYSRENKHQKEKEKALADYWYNKSHATQLNSVMGPLRKMGVRYGIGFSSSSLFGFFKLS